MTYREPIVAASQLGSGTPDGTKFLRDDLTWQAAGGGISDGDKGDITVSSSGTVWTIDNNAVTLAKIATISASTILGNNTGGAASPSALTASQVKTLLAIAAGDVSGLGTLATQSGTFSGTSSGTNTGDQTITLTGDVTGSGTGTFAATIANGAVTLGKMANLAANSLIGNNTGIPATPIALTTAQAKTLLAITNADVSGLGTLATQNGTFSGTSSGTNTGDVTLAGTPDYITISGQTITRGLVDLATDVTGDLPLANLAQASAASRQGLGRGSAAGAGDYQEITLGTNLSMSGTTLNASSGGVSDGDKGDITVSASGATWAIDNAAVTYAKVQNVAANSFLANATGSPATVQEIATTRIPLFASAITGTPSGTTYLRGDGAWATVSAADPSGYTTIIKSSNQDVTNAGVTNDTQFSFATTAGGIYAISMDLFVSGDNTTADYTMDFRVDAGTMRGKGTVQNLTTTAAVANVIMTAAGAANTTAVRTGVPTANLNDLVFVRVAFACSVSNATTFRFRFGNATPTTGATSRTWKGSVFRYKSLL